jgi:hypothetical protein
VEIYSSEKKPKPKPHPLINLMYLEKLIINPPEYCSNPKNQGKDTTLIEPNLSRCRPFTPGLNKKVNFNVKKRSKNIKFKLKS